MEKLLAIIYFFGVLSVICPIINYLYLYLASKFKFHQGFVNWLMGDTNEDYFFFAPLCSWVTSFFIIIAVLYSLVFKPLYYVIIIFPLKGIEWFSKILMKPIKKVQFKNKISQLPLPKGRGLSKEH